MCCRFFYGAPCTTFCRHLCCGFGSNFRCSTFYRRVRCLHWCCMFGSNRWWNTFRTIVPCSTTLGPFALWFGLGLGLWNVYGFMGGFNACVHVRINFPLPL